MPNVEGMTKSERRIEHSALRHLNIWASFVIRHSSFVIRASSFLNRHRPGFFAMKIIGSV
jgi:hypothetical protein